MKSAEQDAIVLYTVLALKNEGSWTGETHVQKALYLCQELTHIPSAFKFILYKHGPYSFELSAHLQELISDDLVCVQSRPPYGATLGVSHEGRHAAERIDDNRDIFKKVSFIAKKLGNKGVSDLEKLATAVYVIRKYGTNNPMDKRVEILTSIKPHVPPEAARKAFEDADAIELEARSTLIQ